MGEQGYRQDEATGLSYLRARHYDAKTGQFVSQDPLGPASGDGNYYRYTRNDPIDAIDPSGMDAISLPANVNVSSEVIWEVDNVGVFSRTVCSSFAVGTILGVPMTQAHVGLAERPVLLYPEFGGCTIPLNELRDIASQVAANYNRCSWPAHLQRQQVRNVLRRICFAKNAAAANAKGKALLPIRMFFVADECNPLQQKVVRKVYDFRGTILSPMQKKLANPETYGMSVSTYNAGLESCTNSLGQAVLADGVVTILDEFGNPLPQPINKSRFLPASTLSEGAGGIGGRPVWIDVNKFKASGGIIHEYDEIAADLDRMSRCDPQYSSRAKAWKNSQAMEGEVLLEGDVPAAACKSKLMCRMTRCGQVAQFAGVMLTMVDFAAAAAQCGNTGNARP